MRLCYGVFWLLPNAPGEGQIEIDRLSQHTAALHDPIPSETRLEVQGFVLMQDNDPTKSTLKAEEQHVLQLMS